MTQWVQHISGQGEKWEVRYDDKHTSQWGVQVGTGIRQYYHWLPKSEYSPCDPPPPKWVPIDAVHINVQVLNRDGVPVSGKYRMLCSNIEKLVPHE